MVQPRGGGGSYGQLKCSVKYRITYPHIIVYIKKNEHLKNESDDINVTPQSLPLPYPSPDCDAPKGEPVFSYGRLL